MYGTLRENRTPVFGFGIQGNPIIRSAYETNNAQQKLKSYYSTVYANSTTSSMLGMMIGVEPIIPYGQQIPQCKPFVICAYKIGGHW